MAQRICTSGWHEPVDYSKSPGGRMDYCPSCGEREDGRKSLASLGVMEMAMTVMTLRNDRTGQVAAGRIAELTETEIVVGEERIPLHDIHEWIVTHQEAAF